MRYFSTDSNTKQSDPEPVPNQELQAPVDDTQDYESQFTITRIAIILPLTWYFLYKLFFVRKNTFSREKEYSIISESFERNYVGAKSSNLLLKEFEGRVYKQESDEVKRVRDIVDKIVAKNNICR